MPNIRVQVPGVGIVEFPEGTSEQTMREALSTLPQGVTPARASSRSWTDTAVDALPTVGGALGGFAGGVGGTVAGVGVGGLPGAIGGATLGGATGEAAKQLINRLRGAPAPTSASEAAQGIGTEGAIQGASEVAGAGLGAAARVGGKALMENAVRPTMTLVREFPDVVDTIIANRLPVGRILPGIAKGSEQAAAKLGAAGRSVRALLAKAGQAGTTFTGSDVAQPVVDLVQDLAKQPLGEAEQRRVAGMIQEFLDRHPGPLTPDAVKDLKQAAQAIAKPIYASASKGFPVTADQALGARFNSAIASGAKSSLETIPGVAAGEAQTQELIGATRALKSAENRRLSLMAEGASVAVGSGAGAALGQLLGPDSHLDGPLKQSVIGWLVTRGLLSPRSMSRGALVLTSQAAQAALRQFPRLAEEWANSGSTTETAPGPAAPQ